MYPTYKYWVDVRMQDRSGDPGVGCKTVDPVSGTETLAAVWVIHHTRHDVTHVRAPPVDKTWTLRDHKNTAPLLFTFLPSKPCKLFHKNNDNPIHCPHVAILHSDHLLLLSYCNHDRCKYIGTYSWDLIWIGDLLQGHDIIGFGRVGNIAEQMQMFKKVTWVGWLSAGLVTRIHSNIVPITNRILLTTIIKTTARFTLQLLANTWRIWALKWGGNQMVKSRDSRRDSNPDLIRISSGLFYVPLTRKSSFSTSRTGSLI